MSDLGVILAQSPVAEVLCTLILVYTIVIFGAILMSWFPISPESPMYSVFRFLRSVTDPVLLPLRRIIPPVGGMLDLSPMILIIGLGILRAFIC